MFYISRVIDDSCTAVTNVELPRNHRQLPQWVIPLLEEQLDSASDRDCMVKHIDAYLKMFVDTNVSNGVKFLRRINWACLPLHWQPLFLRTLPVRVSTRESALAQARLIKNVQGPNDNPVVIDEALALLSRITGIDI